MPTIICIRGYRFFFVSFDGSEPMHVHVRKDGLNAKVWMSPLRIAWSDFKEYQEKEILRMIEENCDLIENKWHEHFG
ncbi:MAG TPA: DUF4160 domain-containing protein [Kiritimatiellia bacterium]|nr:DUF4160 domain-containing protein [Kiritimatiellia bacterium]HMP00225.1 DUF4160 domain-containing protein [Kiritimatiellia bacterium]